MLFASLFILFSHLSFNQWFGAAKLQENVSFIGSINNANIKYRFGKNIENFYFDQYDGKNANFKTYKYE